MLAIQYRWKKRNENKTISIHSATVKFSCKHLSVCFFLALNNKFYESNNATFHFVRFLRVENFRQKKKELQLLFIQCVVIDSTVNTLFSVVAVERVRSHHGQSAYVKARNNNIIQFQTISICLGIICTVAWQLQMMCQYLNGHRASFPVCLFEWTKTE